MTRRDFSLTLSSFLAGGLAGAPRLLAQDDSVIHVDVDLVNVVFSVRKASGGELVPNLTKDDFLLFEDGKPQTVAHFSRDQNLPFSLGMLVDVSRSQANLMDTEKQAGSSFFSSTIRPHDEAFLLAFGHDTVLIQDFTGSVPKLKSGLDSLKVDVEDRTARGGGGQNGGGNGNGGGSGGGRGGGMSWPGGGMGWPGGGGMGGRGGGRGRGGNNPQSGSSNHANHKGTLMFDGIYLACTDEINHKQGRKALLLITDGEDRGSYYSRGQAIEAAQRADAIVYSIYYADPKMDRGDRGGGPKQERGNGLEDLQKLSSETGGRVFKVSKDHTLEDAFTELQAEMRSQYSLGYKSANPNRDGEYREIEIRPKNPAFQVQTRKGYYAIKNSAAPANPS